MCGSLTFNDEWTLSPPKMVSLKIGPNDSLSKIPSYVNVSFWSKIHIHRFWGTTNKVMVCVSGGSMWKSYGNTGPMLVAWLWCTVRSGQHMYASSTSIKKQSRSCSSNASVWVLPGVVVDVFLWTNKRLVNIINTGNLFRKSMDKHKRNNFCV